MKALTGMEIDLLIPSYKYKIKVGHICVACWEMKIKEIILYDTNGVLLASIYQSCRLKALAYKHYETYRS